MAHYPQSAVGLNYTTQPEGPDPLGATITASGSTNTKGSYVQLEDSSAFTCNNVLIKITATSTSSYSHLADLAIGAAASETVVVPNFVVESNALSLTGLGLYHLPLQIPSGTRIAARTQSTTGSATFAMAITLVAAGDTEGCTAFTDYGLDTGTSLPTLVDPGAVANTKGSYAEITSSTSAVAQVLNVMMSTGNNGALSSFQWAIDIATGAAASEVVLIPDLRNCTHSATDSLENRSYTFLTYIAASTRIAARCSCSGNDATDRRMFVGLLAATAPAESSGTPAIIAQRRGGLHLRM